MRATCFRRPFYCVLTSFCRRRREDRKITAVRVFVAAHEWIVECVGVVDIQSGEAFAAVFAPANEKDGRVSTGEAKDEAEDGHPPLDVDGEALTEAEVEEGEDIGESDGEEGDGELLT